MFFRDFSTAKIAFKDLFAGDGSNTEALNQLLSLECC
jgi:hypothetical protein